MEGIVVAIYIIVWVIQCFRFAMTQDRIERELSLIWMTVSGLGICVTVA
jgi:hypothetical protein